MAMENTFKYMTVDQLKWLINDLDGDIALHPNVVGNLNMYRLHDPYEDADQSDGALIADDIENGVSDPIEFEFIGYIDFLEERVENLDV